MNFAVGSEVGPYRIVAELGEGGMGVVYRARDSRLGRDVAIKVSAKQFAERFEREARAVAALNHPNICTLYDIGPDYLVMELVEGRTLTEVLARRPASALGLPVGEALPIARQIAAALDAAHEKGIVHRDLKPGNIKITADGTVKVLDFGLARIDGVADASRVSSADDLTASPAALATQAGVILGTAAYMAPEQARGNPIDRRADIWAFGIVFYEMLTGRRPFYGEDIAGTIAAVIQSDPNWDDVPVEFRRLLKKCLEKDPKRRFRDIGDVWDLQDRAASSATPRGDGRLGWAVAALTTILAGVALWSPWRAESPRSTAIVRHSIDLGPDAVLPALQYPSPSSFSISPDASRLVYQSGIPGSVLYMKRLDQWDDARAEALRGTEDAENPYFSADGKWIVFSNTRGLKRVSAGGGDVQDLTSLELSTGADWNGDQLVATSGLDGAGLVRVPPQGGAWKSVVDPGHVAIFVGPQLLPGGRSALVWVSHFLKNGGPEKTSVEVVSMADGTRTTVVPNGNAARYLSSGHLIYSDGTRLLATRFDVNARKVQGEPVPIVKDAIYDVSGQPQFSVSDSGTLVYRPASTSVTKTGVLDAAGFHSLEAGPVPTPFILSPDGAKVAFISRSESGQQDVYVKDLRQGSAVRVTRGEAMFLFPIWSSDGDYIVAGALRAGLFVARADGGAPARQLFPSRRVLKPMAFRPGDTHLAYIDITGAFTLFTVPTTRRDGVTVTGAPKAFLPDSFQRSATFSPDGGWLAYETTENGRPVIHAQPFPGPGRKVPISTGSGMAPVWLRDKILYLSNGKIMFRPCAVRGGELRLEKEQVWKPVEEDVSWYSTDATGTNVSLLKVEGHADHVLRIIPNLADYLRSVVR